MDLHALKNFLVIAEEENITKAAERLCISQPPLSRQLKKLESDLNVKLFERAKQRIHLTKEGQYLFEAGKRIFELIDKTELQLKEMSNGTTETLFLGATQTTSLSVLPDCTDSFREKYPHYKYNIRSGNSNYIFNAMKNDLIDIGIVLEPYNTDYFEGFRILDGYWMAVINKSHPLSQLPGDSIDTTMLSGQDIILSERKASQYDLIRFIESMEQQPNIICSFNLPLNGIHLAVSNMGIVILPSTSKDIMKRYPELTCKKLTAPEFPLHVAMIKRKKAVPSSLANLFYEFHKNRFSEHTHD